MPHHPTQSQTEEILKKYEDQHFPMDLALPVQTNQEMNHYLKDLCELCGPATTTTNP